ncbi:MAG: ATP-binding protein [Muribaculaceae bacterium]|nr:ATP-binding protein [Muribaculaceae bacterium]
MNNPFVTNGYAGEHYFCDRVEETRALIDLLTNGNNVALISPRRLGKTGLMRHCFAQPQIKDNYYTFLIDIYATSSLQEFVNVLGRSVMDALKPFGRKMLQRFIDVVTSLRADISFDVFGQPSWGVSMGSIDNPETSLDEIFRFLEDADHPCLVAIDEFQQISAYGAKATVEALLRTHIQRCRNANFVFAGSQRHLMDKMFTSPSRPFYQSVALMNLHPLALGVYRDFATRLFAENNKTLQPDVVDKIYADYNGVTAYMQRLMNVLFMRTAQGETCTIEMIEDAVDYTLNMASDTYEALLRQIPEKQRNVFIAIAIEGEVANVTSGAFARKYHLPSASSVNSAVKGLLAKDFITLDKNGYHAYDKLFAMWVKRYMNIQ